MTHDELAKEFHVLNGGHWNIGAEIGKTPLCRICGLFHSNPTYPTAESILKVMMDRDDFSNFVFFFIKDIINCYTNKLNTPETVISFCKVITEPDNLLTAAVEWCREHPLEVKR